MSRHADQSGLQRFTRGVFIAGGDNQQVTPQAVKVSVVKSAPGHFISFDHPARQRRHLQRLTVLVADVELSLGWCKLSVQIGALSAS